MREIIKSNIVELFCVLAVFIDIFFTIIPPLPLAFVLIIVSLYRNYLIGSYVLSAFALPILLGNSLYLLGITRVASILEILLLFMCLFQWKTKRIILFNFREGVGYLLLVILVFIVSALVSSGGNYAFTKVKDCLLNGLFLYFAFGFLISNPDKCNYTRIGLTCIVYSLLMLLLSPLFNGGAGPESIIDFGYLRMQNSMVIDEERLLIDYQHTGFFATMGIGIMMLDSLKGKTNIVFTVMCISFCILISLYSGARQFVVTSVVLMILWVLLTRKKNFGGILILVIAIALIAIVVSSLLASEGMLGSVKEEGYLDASGRSVHLLLGIKGFLEHPYFGIGFGRFNVFGEYGAYPHNMFVEILCEMGVVGLIILTILVYKPLKYLIVNEKPCIFLLMVLFLRSMASGGLDSNIMVFSFIFAVISLKPVNGGRKKYVLLKYRR